MPDDPANIEMARRTRAMQFAERRLTATVDAMRLSYGLNRTTLEMVKEITGALGRETVPPTGLTVFLTLHQRSLDGTTTSLARNQVPTLIDDGVQAVRNFLQDHGIQSAERRRIARNVMQPGPAKYDRLRDELDRAHLESRAPSKSVLLSGSRGRPKVWYTEPVTRAFIVSIESATGRKFTIGSRGDETITENKGGGPMLRVLMAALEWSASVIWLCSRPGTGALPKVSAETVRGYVQSLRKRTP